MSDLKTVFLNTFEEDIRNGKIKSICDFGSGLSSNFIYLLEKYPHLEYVGIEPSQTHAEKARVALSRFSGARIYTASCYKPVADERWGSFDLVVSLSVLEHVKQLELFLKMSVSAARAGGQIVHRYDLGHALFPSSLKERLQVFLGNYFPKLLPEHKFVSGVHPQAVVFMLETHKVTVERITYHQMPAFKKLFKLAPDLPENLITDIVEWELAASPFVEKIDENERLRLFPSVAVWARKI